MREGEYVVLLGCLLDFRLGVKVEFLWYYLCYLYLPYVNINRSPQMEHDYVLVGKLSYEIGLFMTERDKVIEQQLLRESEEILLRSDLGKRDAEFNFNLVLEWIKKNPLDEMTPEAAEAALKESNQLLGRLRISLNELKKMDKDYEDLRKRVNTFYGREVMPQQPEIDYEALWGLGGEEGEDWKK